MTPDTSIYGQFLAERRDVRPCLSCGRWLDRGVIEGILRTRGNRLARFALYERFQTLKAVSHAK